MATLLKSTLELYLREGTTEKEFELISKSFASSIRRLLYFFDPEVCFSIKTGYYHYDDGHVVDYDREMMICIIDIHHARFENLRQAIHVGGLLESIRAYSDLLYHVQKSKLLLYEQD